MLSPPAQSPAGIPSPAPRCCRIKATRRGDLPLTSCSCRTDNSAHPHASGAQLYAGPTCKVLCLRANKEVEGTGLGHQFDVGDRKEGEFQGYILVSVRMLGWVVEPLWAASLAETCQHVLGCRVD